jgi:hypothetical protein
MLGCWKIELFGGLRAARVDVAGARAITHFRTQKTGELLAYLALHRTRRHPREALVNLLWPEEDPISARHRLSVALSSLRRQLEPQGLLATGIVWSGSARALSGSYWTNTKDGAPRYCSELVEGGYGDWRLPVIEELVAVWEHGGGAYLYNTSPGSLSIPKWSSTRAPTPGGYRGRGKHYYCLYLDTGAVSGLTDGFAIDVHCVRSPQ